MGTFTAPSAQLPAQLGAGAKSGQAGRVLVGRSWVDDQPGVLANDLGERSDLRDHHRTPGCHCLERGQSETLTENRLGREGDYVTGAHERSDVCPEAEEGDCARREPPCVRFGLRAHRPSAGHEQPELGHLAACAGQRLEEHGVPLAGNQAGADANRYFTGAHP